MKGTTLKRILPALAALAAAAALAGCGGGTSHDIDQGTSFDPVNGKTIYRSLENETDMYVTVTMWINDREQVDRPVTVRPRSYINVEISNLDVRDYVTYYAQFDNGDKTNGSFSEDGRTVFTTRAGKSTGVQTTEMNGKDAVLSGGETVKLKRTGVMK